MKWPEIKSLANGDELTWNDPAKDDGDCDCSVYNGVIQTITVLDDPEYGPTDDTIICITWQHGAELECFAHELS